MISNDVSRETFSRLQAYVDLLKKWQQKMNLVSRETIQDIWGRHIDDCTQLYPFLDSEKSIADLGCGAGLPGVILSILGAKDIHLFEANKKKCVFLSTVKRELGLSFTIHEGRIEEYHGPFFDIIISRALADLSLLLTYAHPLLKEEGVCLFLKGEGIENEIIEARKEWGFQCQLKQSITSIGGRLVFLESIQRRS